MGFFRIESSSMSLGYGWWIYPAVTIPFTLLILLIWSEWKKRRMQRLRRVSAISYELQGGRLF
jgi:hypothetical protein